MDGRSSLRGGERTECIAFAVAIVSCLKGDTLSGGWCGNNRPSQYCTLTTNAEPSPHYSRSYQVG